jgi:tetratricopeptide (TPR) repeat protein
MNEASKQALTVGREYYEKGDWEHAEERLRVVLETEDRFADVHNMLGVIAHSRGNFVAAERHLEAALAINPAYTEAALNLAVTYNDRGKYEEAKEVYAKLQAVPRTGAAATGLDSFARGHIANMHAALGNVYADAGLVAEAVEQYEQAVALCPSFADLRTRLGALLRSAQAFERAQEHYEAALASQPDYLPAMIQLGVTLMEIGDAKGAEKQWNAALKIAPSNAQAKMYLRVLRER